MLKEVLFIAAALALGQSSTLQSRPRDGIFYSASSLIPVTRITTRDGSRNQYILYTRSDPLIGETISATTDTDELTALLVADAPIIFIVHGQDGSARTSLNPLVKDEILTHEDVNVIVVDWSTYANLGYNVAMGAVPSIAIDLANFISSLTALGYTLPNIHLIGFDLGAHVCGFTGRQLADGRNSIGKITGLNPSGLNWGENSGRLSSNDAILVEIIHTDSVQNGIGIPIGDIDMFINRGRSQPGCSNHLCSHNRAFEIMAASISNSDLLGNHCNTITEMTRNTCRGQALRVGTNNFFKLGSGIYRANTQNTFPF